MDGRTFLITGAQQGIGAAIAIRFAAAGANVAINYLDDAEAAGHIADEARRAGGGAMIIAGDVSSAADVEAMVEAVISRFGELNGVVNNAGIFPRCALVDISEEEWDRVLNVNAKGTFLVTRAAARAMIARGYGGAIVNISSAAAEISPMGAHYGASKGAIQSFTRTAAIELAPHGIRVNAIAPGIVSTAQPLSYWKDEEVQAIGRMMPLKRVGTVEDIAACALYLVSESADFVTGQTINVNGGGLQPGTLGKGIDSGDRR